MTTTSALPIAVLLAATLLLAGCIDTSDDEREGSTSEPPTGLFNPMTTQEINDFILVINDYRARGASCGTEGVFGAQPPLTWNQKLARAAQAHSDDQYEMNQMTHTGSDNSSLGDRIKRQGYAFTAARENVASGYFAHVEQLANAWMNSDGHCANMMAGNVNELGIAATRADSGSGFWTLKLARTQG